MPEAARVLDFVTPIGRENLAGRVYDELRTALFEGRMRPGQRLKIRDLAAAMQVSETPVREAVVQLARERALRLEAARSITVAGLSLEQYLELRTIRLELEGLAAEAAALRISPSELEALERAHDTLSEAEEAGEPLAANRANWAFHHTLYAAAAMPELLSIIESIWLRNGPMHAFLYPDARPAYPGRHRHLDIIEGLRARDPKATRAALRADLTEGGANLVALLGRMERDAAWATPT
ncbi:GntR family transcriptional regulator [Roseomonas sp. SSH11]|uniref:GntR family transcriptional regulator n=1 Tax=Pararoseomonas baculiformis TaxID=2820812 RepID=A0ABS4ACM3_9PROT|nr:GntR family transcriptional regulator [Pararoseomonas baculiformis]MBP0444762.1 GntR family transcriptional regulator [Pararoseomonas baculiformis]